MSERADFDLAKRLRSSEGASLGEVFSFLSGLYFRGKFAYSTHFGRPPHEACSALCHHFRRWFDESRRAFVVRTS